MEIPQIYTRLHSLPVWVVNVSAPNKDGSKGCVYKQGQKESEVSLLGLLAKIK